MGTSGAYGGSPGWEGVADQTSDWLSAGGGTAPVTSQTEKEPTGDHETSDALSQVLATLGKALSGGGGVRGLKAKPRRSSRTATGTSRRDLGRATASGGRAVGGAYAFRSRDVDRLRDLGLDLGSLAALPLHEQARRLVDAAGGPDGDIVETEARLANAAVIIWALSEDVEPTPIELANRWAVEYSWLVWIDETGPTLTDHEATGSSRLQAESELRAALEARIVAHGLPTDRPVTPADFAKSIEGALASLARIVGAQ